MQGLHRASVDGDGHTADDKVNGQTLNGTNGNKDHIMDTSGSEVPMYNGNAAAHV